MEKLYFISTQTAHLFQTIAKIKINYKISKTGKTASVYSKKNGPITHYKGDLKIVAGITIFFPNALNCSPGDVFLSMTSDHR